MKKRPKQWCAQVTGSGAGGGSLSRRRLKQSRAVAAEGPTAVGQGPRDTRVGIGCPESWLRAVACFWIAYREGGENGGC